MGELDDEELGSLLQFKIKRRCRGHSHGPGGLFMGSGNDVFNSTQLYDGALLSPSSSGHPALGPKRLFGSKEVHETVLHDPSNKNKAKDETEVDWMDPTVSLQAAPCQIHHAKTLTDFKRRHTLSVSTMNRTAFMGLSRQPTQRLPEKKD